MQAISTEDRIKQLRASAQRARESAQYADSRDDRQADLNWANQLEAEADKLARELNDQ